MDRQDAQKQKRHEKKESKKVERLRQEEVEKKQVRTIHPAWFVILGVVLIVVIVLFWTMI